LCGTCYSRAPLLLLTDARYYHVGLLLQSDPRYSAIRYTLTDPSPSLTRRSNRRLLFFSRMNPRSLRLHRHAADPFVKPFGIVVAECFFLLRIHRRTRTRCLHFHRHAADLPIDRSPSIFQIDSLTRSRIDLLYSSYSYTSYSTWCDPSSDVDPAASSTRSIHPSAHSRSSC